MPGGQEKRRRSQNQDEAYCSVASASSLINTTNYYQAGNQVMVTDAVQKGEREREREREGKRKIAFADYCSMWLAPVGAFRCCICTTKYY